MASLKKTGEMQPRKRVLVVLDFDGFLVDSYSILRETFAEFGLDIGDVDRFRHRRKFLKYMGGGKEFLGNLVSYTLPKKKKIREKLTEVYMEEGRIYTPFVGLLNRMIDDPWCHVGIISRNFTRDPGITIRKVLYNSGVNETDLDFIIPIPVGVKKHEVLQGMKSTRYTRSVFGADEIGDFRAASETGYDTIIMASYGFDNRNRLIKQGEVPGNMIFDSVKEVAAQLESCLPLQALVDASSHNQVQMR
jgi:phosphoglycolate phosphatase